MDVDEGPPDSTEMPPPQPPTLDQAAAGDDTRMSPSDESDTTIPMTGSDADLAARAHPTNGNLDGSHSQVQNQNTWDNEGDRDDDEDDEEDRLLREEEERLIRDEEIERGERVREEDESEEDEPQSKSWQPMPEDTTSPCEDELKYIISKGEHSATDHVYWEKQTFLDLDDPELVAGESGRIDWLVEEFNGTKEKPNNELIMRSPVVRIGGLDWQIKLYPKGDNSYCLSAYVECVSMKEASWASTEPFEQPPFPWLKGIGQERQRSSVAAQLSIVMYNPAEPRVYKSQVDAHQFHKGKNDYGWKYFLDHSQEHIHVRNHAQRQAMLRNDRLAFKAYIRIVEDPTRNQWQHLQHDTPASRMSRHIQFLPEDVISITGLRPFRKSMQYICGVVPLLHFAPFRKFVQELPPDKQSSRWLQPLLLRMFTRQLSISYRGPVTAREGDVMEMLSKFSHLFHSENDAALVHQLEDIVGNFHSGIGAACGVNRLNTKDYPSVQNAVNRHPKSISRSQLLTMELTRQEHDKKTRRWKKLTNQVHLDEHIQVEGTSYILFAFITHSGPLMGVSSYKSYVRPNGHCQGWYCYSDGLVRRLTEKQASDLHSGRGMKDAGTGEMEDNQSSDRSFYREHVHEEHNEAEVPSIVMYVRKDMAAETFEAPTVEAWVPPSMRHKQSLESLHEMHCSDQTAKQENWQRGDDPEEPSPEGPEEADLARLTTTFVYETNASTPEPGRMDGEDTIMQDVDEESIFMTEMPDMPEMDVADDTPLQKGTFSWLGRCHYEGQWKNGKYHGGGHHIDVNGDEYLGKFESGYKHGYGKMIYASTGDIYEGDWLDGQRHGTGKYTELATGNVYEGGWLHDRKHGAFVLTGTFPEEEKSLCTICYDQELSTAFVPCGHVIACQLCARQLHECPMCRRPVQARQELYGVKFSLQ